MLIKYGKGTKKFLPYLNERNFYLAFYISKDKLFLEEVLYFFVRNHLFIKNVSTSFVQFITLQFLYSATMVSNLA